MLHVVYQFQPEFPFAERLKSQARDMFMYSMIKLQQIKTRLNAYLQFEMKIKRVKYDWDLYKKKLFMFMVKWSSQ